MSIFFKKVYSIEFLPMVIFCPDIGLDVVGIWKSTVGSGAVAKKKCLTIGTVQLTGFHNVQQGLLS